MAEENQDEKNVETPPKSKLPMMVFGLVAVAALVAFGAIFMLKKQPIEPGQEPRAEYQVVSKMYQLQDGSYIKLGFSIVVAKRHLETVRNIIEVESPGRLPDGITLLLGDKGREELINGTHKRAAFARELKKMIEERVFHIHNQKQTSAAGLLEVKEVLISDYVTQAG